MKTVSRVVNNEPGVSEDLTQRVRWAIAQLGYHHNLTASSLRRSDQRTATIGLLLADVSNPFSGALHRAIEDVARRHGVAVVAGSLDEDPERERELVNAFAGRRVDGLVIAPAGQNHSYLLNESRAGTAIVFVDRPPAFFDGDVVLADNRAGAFTGVRHLVQHGHTRIGLLGDLRSIYTARERSMGANDAAVAAGLALEDRYVRMDLHDVDSAEAATIELLSGAEPPTALFASQNLVTIGAIRALRRLQLHAKVALVGFDDFPLADLLEPGVTVVAQDPAAMGRVAAEELFRRIAGDQTASRHHVIPSRLLARGSGEIAPR